jgi:hypothetical protein
MSSVDEEELRPEDVDAFFVSYRESKSGKTHAFYLSRGSDGREVLGAVGEEAEPGGDVSWRNARNFTNHGHLDTDDRAELIEWLDGIVAEGIARMSVDGTSASPGGKPAPAPPASGAAPGPAPGAPASPDAFVHHSQEKFVFPDGRRGIRFYLVDAQGNAVPAVLGEERDTRDGHYTYRKEDNFNRGPPLACGNLAGVHRWLRDLCGGGGSLVGGFGAHPPKPKGSGPGGRSRGGVGGFGGGGGGDGGGRDPLGAADLKRKRESSYFESDHTGDDVDAPTRAAMLEEREVRWTAARRAALAYVREEIHPHTAGEIDRVQKALSDFGAESEGAADPPRGGSKKAKAAATAALAKVIEALRTLNSQYVSLRVLEKTDIREAVMELRSHPSEVVSRMAKHLVAQWVGALRSHVGTLAASYERPPPPPPPPAPSASKPSKPRPIYDAAYIASRRNEPELRATRGATGSILRKPEKEEKPAAPEPRPPPKEKKPKPSPTTPAAPKSHKKTTATYQPHHPGTPLGKGRKLCQECNGVVGSPTRICPHCNATLPFKQAGNATSPKAKANAANAGKAQGGQGGQGGGGGGAVPSSSTVAAFLSRHQERFASCKVSQLKRAVGEVSAGVKAAVDAGRIADPAAAKHLAEFAKKIADVRLLQGVVERPRARREVIAHIEAAVKTCNKYGI